MRESPIPPYPYDERLVSKVGWLFNYGPMILVCLIVSSLLAVAVILVDWVSAKLNKVVK
jgi:hypothetical protein